MHQKLKKNYFLLLFPALLLFIGLGISRQMNVFIGISNTSVSCLYPAGFILAAITAIAAPLFMRTWFAHAVRQKNAVPAKIFMRFQKKILWVCLITPYLAFLAILCDFPRFHAAAIVLLALYSVYYYFPSEKRIAFDRKIFRVQLNEQQQK